MENTGISNTYTAITGRSAACRDQDPRRRRRSAPGLADGGRADRYRLRWDAAASRPTSARATAGPRKAPFGRGSCGGAPTATRGRGRSCRSAPSGPKTPGAKTHQAATTTSRSGWIAAAAATGSGATTISMISSSRSITTARRVSGAAAARYSCIWRARISGRPPAAYR